LNTSIISHCFTAFWALEFGCYTDVRGDIS
jgi:hypothetical protein